MEIDLNGIQALGIWLMVTGLVLNTFVFVFSYYKIAARIKELKKEVEGEDADEGGVKKEEEKTHFPIIRFVVHFRKFVKELQEPQAKENYELVIAFVKWTLLLGMSMIIIGLVLFLFGFLF